MRLLDRYLLRELLVPLAYCLGGFLIFYCSFDLINRISFFQDNHLRFLDCLEYYLTLMPDLLVLLLPVALLLGLLYALANHARHQELTAMRAAGVSLWRLALPYFGVGLVFALVVFALGEWVAPVAAEQSEFILGRRVGAPQDRNWKSPVNFQNEPEGRTWRIQRFNLVTGEMIEPFVDWKKADGSEVQIYAERAFYANREWTFTHAGEWDTAPGAPAPVFKTNVVLRMDFAERPEMIRADLRISNLKAEQAAKRPQFSIAQITQYLAMHPQVEARQRAMLETQWQGRLAEPVKCLMVVLIALPFGAQSGRRNVFVGVASSIFIVFSYFVLQRLSLASGTGQYLPPVLAAWLPNVVFGVVGLVLAARMR